MPDAQNPSIVFIFIQKNNYKFVGIYAAFWAIRIVFVWLVAIHIAQTDPDLNRKYKQTNAAISSIWS